MDKDYVVRDADGNIAITELTITQAAEMVKVYEAISPGCYYTKGLQGKPGDRS